MKIGLSALALAIAATYSVAQPKRQDAASTAAPRSQAAGASEPVRGSGPVPVSSPAASVSQPDIQAIRDQLSGVATGVAKLESRPSTLWWTTALTALGSALVGGLLSAWVAIDTQRRSLRHQEDQAKARAEVEKELLNKKGSFDESLADRKATFDEALAERKARTEVEHAMFQWRIQQLTELYGPLSTLFGQSNTVYRLMNEVLAIQHSTKFRFKPNPTDADPDGKVFEIYDGASNEWRRFRAIIDWDQVYGSGLGVDAYLDEVLDVGEQISEIVTKKAGLVMVHHGELLDTFSQYLAHYRVLRQLYNRSRSLSAGQSPTVLQTPVAVRESAAFPIQIQSLVKSGLDELLRELAKSPIQGKAVPA